MTGASFASLLHVEERLIAAPKLVTQTASNTGSNTGSTKTAVMPPGIVAGNLLLLLCRERNTGSNILTFPAGWTEKWDTSGSGLAWRVADGSEGASINYTGQGNRSANCVLQISGWASSMGAAAIEVAAVTGNSANPDPPSITPSWSGPTLYVAFEGIWATVNTTAGPSGYINFQNTKATNDPNASTATKESITGGVENPGVFTNSGTTTWGAMTVAIRSASALRRIADEIREREPA